jgi:hypothetical protein
VPRFEQDDTSGVPDGSEADGFESGVHETAMLETIAAAVACNDLGLQAPGVETDGATEEDIEAFEGNAGDMGAEDTGESVVGRCAGARIIDACEIGVEVQRLRHREPAPFFGKACGKNSSATTGVLQ